MTYSDLCIPGGLPLAPTVSGDNAPAITKFQRVIPYVNLVLTHRWSVIFGLQNFTIDPEENLAVSPSPSIISFGQGLPGITSETTAKEDLATVRETGFLHWEDNFVARNVERLQSLPYFWGIEGLSILRSIFTSSRLQGALQEELGMGPYLVRHCMWWKVPGAPGNIFLKTDTGHVVDKCLGIHVLSRTTRVRYFTGSHTHEWLPTGWPWFTNCEMSELEKFDRSEPMSNGL